MDGLHAQKHGFGVEIIRSTPFVSLFLEKGLRLCNTAERKVRSMKVVNVLEQRLSSKAIL